MNDQDLIEHIEHSGVVTGVDTGSGSVTVSIIDADECPQCPAANLCAAAKGTHSITIKSPDYFKFKPGDKVTLTGTERMHRKAIMIATVIPCIILVAIMVVIYVFTANQVTAALGGIASMLFFFTLLYVCRNKIAHEFQFNIKHYHP